MTARLPCGCLGAKDTDGYTWIAAEGFLCEAGHKQGDLVEVREGLARLPKDRPRLGAGEGSRPSSSVALNGPEISRCTCGRPITDPCWDCSDK